VNNTGVPAMASRDPENKSVAPAEERRLLLEQKRFELDSSFARKWLPILVTLIAGLIVHARLSRSWYHTLIQIIKITIAQ